MPRVNANPEAEARVAFDVVKPGIYKLRVEEITGPFDSQKTPGNKYLKLRASFVPGQTFEKLDGLGETTNPGNIFDNGLLVEPAEKQGKLRSLVEACQKTWADLDTDELHGLEFEAKIKIEQDQNGEPRNVMGFYIAPKG